ELYQWLLERVAEDEDLWGWNTPREIAAELAGKLGELLFTIENDISDVLAERAHDVLIAPRPSVAALVDVTTRLLEEVYYSERVFPESFATLAERLVERLEPWLRQGPRPRRRRFVRPAVEQTRDTLFGGLRR